MPDRGGTRARRVDDTRCEPREHMVGSRGLETCAVTSLAHAPGLTASRIVPSATPGMPRGPAPALAGAADARGFLG